MAVGDAGMSSAPTVARTLNLSLRGWRSSTEGRATTTGDSDSVKWRVRCRK